MSTVKELLGEELYLKVQSKLGSNKGLIIDDGMLIPKHRFDCINLSLREHKKTVAELRENISDMKASAEKGEHLQTALDLAKTELETQKIVFNAKPKNYKAVLSLINTDGLTGKKLDASLKKQVSEIKKAEPYLFYDAPQLYKLVPVSQSGQTEFENE